MSIRIGIGVDIWANRGDAIDPDAAAFLTATGITNPTQVNAVIYWFNAVKTAGFYTKLRAAYLLVGGSATSHKFNAVNPLDTNNAYRIVWNGGVTHNVNGITGNGINADGVTYINPSLIGATNNQTIGFYCRTNNVGNYTEMGALNAGLYLSAAGRYTGNQGLYDVNGYGSSISSTNGQGVHQAKRTSATIVRILKNGAFTNLTNNTAVGRPNTNMRLLSLSGITSYSINNLSYAFFANELTDAEMQSHETIINTFQTMLGRNV
jgi:hypothetical protein